eukprot:TRINITY_DN9483_c0_g1_i1.p1 TRINITY_DN9483_c0_g1~~TRINITY_DN9483_c0_g1_i1.p1  ORF type:complete len:365 (+),score=184.58 TRINITY_DN9483_c0_g1_i1:69-1097(+)
MALDLSALLGGGGDAPDLADALSSRTSKGDLVFSKPFGDATKWRTGSGYLTFTVIFDPFLPWSRENLLSSTTPNYIANIRRRLGEHLVPDAMTPQVETPEQLKWASIAAALPNKTLHAYLMEEDPATGKKRVEEYLAMLLKHTQAQQEEDVALLEAITTRDFDFTYHLAVDMYPQEKQEKDAKGASGATSREKRGVLVFNIKGTADAPLNSEKAKVGVDALSPSEEPSPKPKGKKNAKKGASSHHTATSDEEEHVDANAKPPMRKHCSAVSKKQQKELEQLLERLELDEDRLASGHCEWIKRVPPTSDSLFEQISTWFDALLQRKQAQLERDGEAVAPGFYT